MRRLTHLAARILYSNLRELSLPYRLTYAVTSRCQARCAMCNIWLKPPDNELSLAEIDTLFSKANRFSWVNLTGGELFQRTDIIDILLTIIRHSRNLYLLNFPTNGIQTEEIVTTVDTILKQTNLPRLIVSVSLDGPPELHDEIRGVPGCWERAVQTFIQLRNRRSARFSVYFGHTIQSSNAGKFKATLNACRSRLMSTNVDDFHINLVHASDHYYDNADTGSFPNPEQAAQEMELIDSMRTWSFFDPIAFIERRYRKYTHHYLSQGRAPLVCQAAAASCFINPEGILFPCTGFAAPLGSLRDAGMDLYHLWHQQTRRQIRKQIRTSDCPGCWTPCEAYQTLLANLVPPMTYR